MADTHTAFYTANQIEVETWTVEGHTAKTWRVSREFAPGRVWQRIVRLSDIGHTFHVTPRAALAYLASEAEADIKRLTDQVQRKRTTLGMIESQIRRLDKAQVVGASPAAKPETPMHLDRGHDATIEQRQAATASGSDEQGDEGTHQDVPALPAPEQSASGAVSGGLHGQSVPALQARVLGASPAAKEK